MRPERAIAALGGALFFGAPALAAQPLPELTLRVGRGPGAEDCADADALRSAIAARGAVMDGPVSLDVEFSRRDGQLLAVVRASGARSGVRSLTVEDDQCAPLVEALTVAIALLLDPDAAEPQAAETAPATAAPAPTAPTELGPEERAQPMPEAPTERPIAPAPARVAATDIDWPPISLSLTPRVAIGLAPAVTFGAELGVMAEWDWFAAEAGASIFAPRSKSHAGGDVRGWFWGGQVAACGQWATRERLQLGGCVVFLAVRLNVEGANYDENAESFVPVLALGPEARATGALGERWGWRLQAAPLASLLRQQFDVIGSDGPAFRVPAVVGWFGVGVWVKIE